MTQNRLNTATARGYLVFCIALSCHLMYFRGWAQKPAPQRQEQEEWGIGRRIEDVQVEIVREKQITLPEANRNFEKISPRFTKSTKPTLTYNFKDLKFTPPAYNFSVRPMRLKEEPISKTYGNFVSVGFGSYISPYLEGWFNSKRSKKHLYGAHIYHRSASIGPVDEGNSATFDSYFKAFGAMYGRVVSGRVGISYENKVGYFYGYTPGLKVRRDTIQQVYHTLAVGATISNTKVSRFNFRLHSNFSYLIDHYEAREGELSVKFQADYAVSEKSAILFTSDYFLINREDAATTGTFRHLLKLKPVFKFSPIENMSITVGANAIVENDTIRDQQFHIYPDVVLQYDIVKNLSAYASITGDFDKVSLHTLSSENFWVNADLAISHTNRSYEFLIGLKGKLGKRVSLGAGFSRVDLKSLYMYKNALENSAKFDVLYDNVERLSFFATARYEKSKKIILNFRADYFSYAAERTIQPWHKPQYQLVLNSFFDIYKKINLNVDFIGRGGMYRLDEKISKAVELDPALDLSLKIDYFLSKPFSVFLKLENILSSNYPVYLNYKVRGFQILVGANWSF